MEATQITYLEASEIWHRYEDANQRRGFVKLEDGRKLVKIAPHFDEAGNWILGGYAVWTLRDAFGSKLIPIAK